MLHFWERLFNHLSAQFLSFPHLFFIKQVTCSLSTSNNYKDDYGNDSCGSANDYKGEEISENFLIYPEVFLSHSEKNPWDHPFFMSCPVPISAPWEPAREKVQQMTDFFWESAEQGHGTVWRTWKSPSSTLRTVLNGTKYSHQSMGLKTTGVETGFLHPQPFQEAAIMKPEHYAKMLIFHLN